MLEAVQHSTPELFSVSVLLMPSHHTFSVETNVLHFAEGMQQGDSLGPLLFYMTIQQWFEFSLGI